MIIKFHGKMNGSVYGPKSVDTQTPFGEVVAIYYSASSKIFLIVLEQYTDATVSHNIFLPQIQILILEQHIAILEHNKIFFVNNQKYLQS